MVFGKMVLGFVAVASIAVLSAGCGGGLDEEDAKELCDQERAAKSQCVTDESFSQCLTAYEECDGTVVPQATCPEEYICDEN